MHSLGQLEHILSRSVMSNFLRSPLSMEFSRQKCRSGLPLSPSGDLLNPGIKAMSPLPVLTNLESKNVPSELKSRLNIKLRDLEDFLQKNVNNIYKWKKREKSFPVKGVNCKNKDLQGVWLDAANNSYHNRILL